MNAVELRRFASDPLAFCDALIIPSVHGPQVFSECMAPFQRQRFASLAPALIAVARGERPPIGRYFFEATKGSSKDGDAACALLWLLAFSRRALTCQIGAADQDQADELRKAARDILRLTRWLSKRIEVQNWKIACRATGSEANIIAADVAGSHGARPDVLILNELSHITKQEFAENLMDNAAKVPHGLVVIASNAGMLGTWQHQWRELAIESDRWCFEQWSEPAPWLDSAEITEAKRRNSKARYLRLWWGVWATGTGDALDPADIDAAITLRGPMTNIRRIELSEWSSVAGLDVGVTRDHSGLVVLGSRWGSNRIQLFDCKSWAPSSGQPVDLASVEQAAIAAHRQFGLQTLYYDPAQCEYIAQNLRRRGLVCEPMHFVGRNLDMMASTLLEVFTTHCIDLYDDPALIRDLKRLSIVEKSYGYKLESVRDVDGHADRATALAICLPAAMKLAHRRAFVAPGPHRVGHFRRDPILRGVQLSGGTSLRDQSRDDWMRLGQLGPTAL